ncbi:DUF5017 domain-containing protein [Pedobacter xixiisoli]|nr:DUF5017 domain-containing protein [Pedobacter xixiisoli]
MNKFKYILGALLITSVYACKKDNPEELTFNVSTSKAEYNVADSVEFNIEGYADVIGFYSGESGKEYRFRNRLEANDAKVFLDISTQVLNASQRNNLSLWYSTDFTKVYTPEGIQNSTWTDITSRFTLAPDGGTAASAVVPSGKIDITDLVVLGKPIFFGFKYVAQNSPTAGTGGRTWRVPVFNLTSEFPGGTSSLANVTDALWTAVDVKNPANKWIIQATTPFLYFAPNSTLTESEDWAITRDIFTNKVNPDKGVGIKAYIDKIKNYKYKFSTPGTYTVTFVGKNGLNGNVKEVVRELTVTVK